MTRVIVAWLVVAGALGGVLVVLLRHAPWDAPSYLAWSGLLVSAFGLLCAAWPVRLLGVRTRGQGLLLLVVGLAVALVAVNWPTRTVRVSAPDRRLDRFLPEYQFREYHEVRTRAAIGRVRDAVRQVSFADMPVALTLLRLRGLAGGRLEDRAPAAAPILDLLATPGSGFLALDTSDPGDLVFGMAGQPWASGPPPAVTTADQFLAFTRPGHIRVGFDMRVVDEGGGVVRVSTETRAIGNDDTARRTFARYWRLVYPGSAIIRQVWLEAIVRRAETHP